ncbi:MAG: ATP-binding protein [Bacteroidetes bacterium]|nr:MAG: ATP-binding protein [Bacteroidota bacterium]
MNSRTDAQKLLSKQLVLESRPEIIHQIESVIEDIRTDFEFKEDVYGNVMVAVTEAVNNSVFHGNKGDASKKIVVDFEMPHQYRLLVRVTDEGEGFDPSSLSDPTAPENLQNIGGRGVFLMQHLSDELHFEDDGRTVEMYFNI